MLPSSNFITFILQLYNAWLLALAFTLIGTNLIFDLGAYKFYSEYQPLIILKMRVNIDQFIIQRRIHHL